MAELLLIQQIFKPHPANVPDVCGLWTKLYHFRFFYISGIFLRFETTETEMPSITGSKFCTFYRAACMNPSTQWHVARLPT